MAAYVLESTDFRLAVFFRIGNHGKRHSRRIAQIQKKQARGARCITGLVLGRSGSRCQAVLISGRGW
jgi:hypothetical protein